MKKINVVWTSTILALALALNLNVSAQTPATPSPGGGGGGASGEYAVDAARRGLPIRSLAVLKAYAEAEVKQGYLQVIHPGIIPNGVISVGIGVDSDADANTIVGRLRSAQMSVGLGNTDGPVYLWATLHDKDGHRLFEDSKTSVFQKNPDGTFWIRDNSLSLKLVSTPAIKVPGLVSARGVFYNKEGNATFNGNLNIIDGGYLMYPTNFVERVGEIYLTFQEKDGSRTTTVIDSGSGAAKAVRHATGFVGVSIEGDYYFGMNPKNVALYGVDIRSAIATFDVQALPDGSVPGIGLAGYSASGEVPIGVLFRTLPATGDDPWIYSPISLPTPSSMMFIGLPQGRYQLVYILTPADLDGIPIQLWPGEKG